MKKILFLIVGIGVGFVAAHEFSKTQKGESFFSGVDEKAREFSSAVIDGYRTRELELRDAVANAQDALDKLR
jgi:hypothetical protein